MTVPAPPKSAWESATTKVDPLEGGSNVDDVVAVVVAVVVLAFVVLVDLRGGQSRLRILARSFCRCRARVLLEVVVVAAIVVADSVVVSSPSPPLPTAAVVVAAAAAALAALVAAKATSPESLKMTLDPPNPTWS